MAREPGDKGFQGYLTVRDAASFLGVSVSTLRNWDRADKLKALRHPLNGYRLYRRSDLRALLASIDGPRDGRRERHGTSTALPQQG